MSRESMEWLNTMTLIGFTEKRGNAWHYKQALQGVESNHYIGAIPLEDVTRRLFNFTVDDTPLYIKLKDGSYSEVPGRKAMATSDTSEVLGVFKEGYQGHQYNEWLLEMVADILDDTLSIGSAGLLRKRAQAWVSVEVPDNITTPEGVEFRPNLLAYTSFDGSLATGYGRKVTAVVCDNTFEAARSEAGQQFKLRHSKYSSLRLNDAREALAIVHTMADDFMAEVAALCNKKVDDGAFNRLLDVAIPLLDDKGAKIEGRGLTMATKKRDEVKSLYVNDKRAAQWNGTAYGVLAAFNTWNHHFATVRGEASRGMRNMENAINGKTANADNLILAQLEAVLV
jgi:phage/plasmid-like protein (TIGR03299 family)